jgi:hypothetical protein
MCLSAISPQDLYTVACKFIKTDCNILNNCNYTLTDFVFVILENKLEFNDKILYSFSRGTSGINETKPFVNTSTDDVNEIVYVISIL